MDCVPSGSGSKRTRKKRRKRKNANIDANLLDEIVTKLRAITPHTVHEAVCKSVWNLIPQHQDNLYDVLSFLFYHPVAISLTLVTFHQLINLFINNFQNGHREFLHDVQVKIRQCMKLRETWSTIPTTAFRSLNLFLTPPFCSRNCQILLQPSSGPCWFTVI